MRTTHAVTVVAIALAVMAALAKVVPVLATQWMQVFVAATK